MQKDSNTWRTITKPFYFEKITPGWRARGTKLELGFIGSYWGSGFFYNASVYYDLLWKAAFKAGWDTRIGAELGYSGFFLPTTTSDSHSYFNALQIGARLVTHVPIYDSGFKLILRPTLQCIFKGIEYETVGYGLSVSVKLYKSTARE